MGAAVSIEDIRKYYGGVHALDGIELEIGQGEFFGLLGPNGAGKSTLINILAGLVRSDRGRARIMGYDVRADYRMARRCIGVVPQELVFDPFFTVREVLRIQSGYFGLGRENEAWIDELLHELRLADKADTNMRALSGGMKRRVLIAQALVHRPDVVVLDEPTAGVDVEIRNLLWDFIRRLHGEGHTILLTTHYLEEAESMCQRIAILDRGRIVALDSKEQLLASTLGRTLQIQVTCAEPLREIPAAILPKVRRHEGNLLELSLEKGADSIVEVLQTLREAGAEITDLHTERADLEDAFMALTYGRRAERGDAA
ncbi:MAG TPA: ABC transporter ATP-binding protein [Gammaproteobacteria bacterium]|nr:ABC transporter ATP-binding protein [Gammaproteobacteria bacterium]